MHTAIGSQGHLCNCLKLVSLFTAASFWSIDVCAYVHAYVCMCIHVCLCVCAHVHAYVCMCTHRCLCVCTCTRVCVWVWACVCVQLWKVPLSKMSRNKAEERNGARTVSVTHSADKCTDHQSVHAVSHNGVCLNQTGKCAALCTNTAVNNIPLE